MKKINLHIVLIIAWLLLINLSALTILFPFYKQLYLREILTVLIFIVGLLFGQKSTIRDPVYIAVLLLIVIDTFALSMFSETLDVAFRFKLFLKLIVPLVLLLLVPKYIYKESDLNKIFLFVIFSNLLLTLTGPLQAVTGEIAQLYPSEGWSLTNARGGVRRFCSILGDPNIGGIIGGLSPIFISTISRKFWKTKIMLFFIGLIVLFMAQSFTGFISYMLSLFVTVKRKKTFIIVLCVFLIFSVIIIQTSSEYSEFVDGSKVFAAIKLYTRANNYEDESDSFIDAPGILPHSNRMLKDLDFRLFSYLNTNDTFEKILFGTAYNKVFAGTDYNPSGIKPHNGYKELYLTGGVIRLFLYLTLFVITAIKAKRIKSNRKYLPDKTNNISMCAIKTYAILLLIMLTFPIGTYPGVGQIFWVSICVINIVYDRFQKNRPENGGAKWKTVKI